MFTSPRNVNYSKELSMDTKTALILGCGKSLLEMPRDLLNQYLSYGSNYIGLSGITPTYWVCIDSDVLKDTSLETFAAKVDTAYLLATAARSMPIGKLPNVVPVFPDKDKFWLEYFVSGCTSLYVMLKLAYYKGFEKVMLWGHDFDSEWEHFTDDYPVNPLGNVTLIRKKEAMDHLGIAAMVYQRDGRRIINYSHPSELDTLFERGVWNT
jgi:hypothetical protein